MISLLSLAYKKRSIVPAAFLFFLLHILLPVTGPADYPVNPRVSDQVLKQFNLDREFHRCLSVTDGDTIVLESIGAVRLIGIDTPEKNHPMLPLQFMAQQATEFTAKHCLGKKIQLDYDPHDENFRGKYGRVLGYVYLEDGTFLQKELVRSGMAATYTRYPLDESIKQLLLATEQAARHNAVGIWQDNGFAEVRWILKNQARMIRVGFTGRGGYEIGTAGWSLQRIEPSGVAERINELHRWMHEFSPYDFEKQVRAAGYQRVKTPAADFGILAFAMAHRKWGLFYNGYACARIEQEDLESRLSRLQTLLLKQTAPDTIGSHLSDLGFRFIDHLVYDALDRIAEAVPAGLAQIPLASKNNRLIPWYRADAHIGQSAVVHGRIVRTHNSGKACFLNFHNNFTRYMSAVIFADDFVRFPQPPETVYLGKYVAIFGKIKPYEGKPEIVITDPGQIAIIDERN